MAEISFDEVWQRIEAHAGETFRQIRGGEFTYEVRSGTLWPDRTNRGLGRSQFAQAFEHVPLTTTTPLQRLQGPSYLYAVLMEPPNPPRGLVARFRGQVRPPYGTAAHWPRPTRSTRPRRLSDCRIPPMLCG